ncbi:MAG: asparagine synthetase B, partial [Chloroflexi bacterium]
MCGIAGLLLPGIDGQTGRLAAANQSVTRMVESLRHRGPDGCGQQVICGATGPIVVLGHTRLAIIDPSPAGRQPMASADGSALITFNGEIYNFRALRAALRNEVWHSHSDTEVVLKAYARWQRECLAHLRGMFAFALW